MIEDSRSSVCTSTVVRDASHAVCNTLARQELQTSHAIARKGMASTNCARRLVRGPGPRAERPGPRAGRGTWRAGARAAPGPPGAAAPAPAAAELDEVLERARSSAGAGAPARAREMVADGRLVAFGRALGAPRARTTLADLRLHRIDGAALLSPRDSTLKGLQNALRLGVWGTLLLTLLSGRDGAVVAELAAYTLVFVVDAVFLSGAVEFLAIDSLANALLPAYRSRVAVHEAGHFLVAYLLGVLPRAYTLAAAEAVRAAPPAGDAPSASAAPRGAPAFSFTKMQAGCDFCDEEFRAELAAGRITSSTLDAYACIALAGVGAEYVIFGKAEGGKSDIQMLDGILSALGFTQTKADDVVRGAVMRTISLLRAHGEAHLALSRAMSERRSVGECIRVVEENVDRGMLRAAPEAVEAGDGGGA